MDDAILSKRQQLEQEIAGRTLCDQLRKNAEEHADAPAASWKEGDRWRSLSWGEFRDRIAAATLGLAGLGVGRGDFVVLMMGNRPEHVIADQAAVHAGATPSTFYGSLAPEQVRWCAAHCEAKVAILEHRDLLKRWQEIRGGLPALEHLVLLEGDADEPGVLGWDELLARGREALAADPGAFDRLAGAVQPGDPATLLYTSGTTGPPKGVILTHHNVLYECAMIDRLADVADGVSAVSYLPLAHIAERAITIYMPLRKRGHVYFCPDPTQVVTYLREARPSTFFGVPRVWEKAWAGFSAMLAAEPSAAKRRLAHAAVAAGREVVRRTQRGERVPPLLAARHALLDRVVLAKIRAGLGMDRCLYVSSSAAPLPVDVAESFAAIGLPIIEVWGMTETTGMVTANLPGKVRIGTVGPPAAGVELKLAEDGEVLVRAPVNTPGYFKQPEATAALIDADGWLHSGDIGELDAAGSLKIVDRKKELIITAGGKNISPANIENLLKEHPLVGQVLAYGDRQPYVVALIVLDAEVAPGWARQHGVPHDSLAALAEHPAMLEELQHAVDAANQRLSRVEQVKRFRVLPAEWTAESEELTPTLKLKRRVIHAKYAADLEALYA